MKKLLLFASLSEALTGLMLLIIPAFVGKLLLGEELIGINIPLARTFGISLIALGVSCWPNSTASRGMLTYSLLASIYLTSVALEGEFVGKFLWPAIALHFSLTILFLWLLLLKPESSNMKKK